MGKIFPSFRIITAVSTTVSELKVVRRISANDEFDLILHDCSFEFFYE
jgi:hypothetical protein